MKWQVEQTLPFELHDPCSCLCEKDPAGRILMVKCASHFDIAKSILLLSGKERNRALSAFHLGVQSHLREQGK